MLWLDGSPVRFVNAAKNPFHEDWLPCRLKVKMSKPANKFSLRKFPYPYQSMFAICSDVDHAVSLPAYLEFMKFLNTAKDTVYGRGIDLEISNSFWFYNGEMDDQLSYFEGLSNKETAFAPVCRELWQSGHMDTSHTYGNFNTGGFERKFAEQSLETLARHSARIPVWVNHGNDLNHQKVGNYPDFHGAKPQTPAYHLDLLRESGTRFFWAGRTTHVAGQDAAFSVGNQLQQRLQKLALKTKYRKIQRPLPDPPNRLLISTEVEDGSHILEFQRFISRFGEVKNTDFHDLALQLTEANLSALVKSQGFMLLYTHMNENLPENEPFPEAVLRGFQRLQAYAQQQDLLVTTSSRLLGYADLIQHLTWMEEVDSDLTRLHLKRDDHRTLTPADLLGLCIYCDKPEQIRLVLADQELNFQINPPDKKGVGSISIPWTSLEYPL